MLKLYDDPEL